MCHHQTGSEEGCGHCKTKKSGFILTTTATANQPISQSTNQVCTHMTLVTTQLLNAFATGLAEVNSLTNKQKL
jgi:hypothetical protein